MPLRHHSLVAWQRADDLFIELHVLSRSAYPPYERFELGSQTRRSAFSVAVNIVEGCAREHRAEKLLGYCVHVARRLNYIDANRLEQLELKVKRTSAALNGYIRSIRIGDNP